MLSAVTSNKWMKRRLIGTGIIVAVSALVIINSSYEGPVNHTFEKTFNKIVTLNGVNRGQAKEVSKSLPLTLQAVMEKRFQDRWRLANKTCHLPSYKDMRSTKKGRFFRLGRGRIKWCRIPKVGTSYLETLEHYVFHKMLPENGNKPNDTKTMMLVREPYSRLISGYIGKIVTNQPWWKMFGTAIVKKFRPNPSERAMRCGNDVTFPEFLKYFIESQVNGFRPNLHFIPSHKVCNPCGQSFDFIGHLETFKDDISFVLSSVNVSVNLDFSNEEPTMRGKARTIISQRTRIKECESMPSALRKVWWSFHARGLISSDIKFPLSNEQCDTINGTTFGDLAWDAHLQSSGRIDKRKQKRENMVRLYLQVPLPDRIKVRDLLMRDFELYGYDPQPPDLFPEFTDNHVE